MSLGSEAASCILVNPTRSASRIVVSNHRRVSASVRAGLSIRSIALSTNTPDQSVWARCGPVREGGIRRTGGIPGLVTYDKTTVNDVWKFAEFREDRVRDPVGMPVDALEQDRTPVKERFTLEVILRGGHKPMRGRRCRFSGNGCTYCRRELPAPWPNGLIPPHAHDPASSVLSHLRMSNEVQLNLQKYICGHRSSDVTGDCAYPGTIDRRAAVERELLLSAPFENVGMGIYEAGSLIASVGKKGLMNVIPAKPGMMMEPGGVWNISNDTLGLWVLQYSRICSELATVRDKA
jgi:hypothetical protein